jgi:AcrR family transcriptional regulator
MVAGAARLLAERGLQATSFSEVLEATGAPRGSIYHHFPDGKDQLVAAAIDAAGDRAVAFLDRYEGASVAEITAGFLGLWREVLVRSGFRAGCAVLAVTVATDSPDLLDRAAGIFRRWRGRLADLFEKAGLDAHAAARLAATLVASSEGAVVMSRAEQSLEPFDLVAAQLQVPVRAAPDQT